MRLAPLACLPLLLSVSASASVARAATSPLTGGPTPDGSAIFTADPFGYLICDPLELTPTDPADKTKALPPARWCSSQGLSIHEVSTTPPQSVGLADAVELPLAKLFIDATDTTLYDPATDVATASTRSSVFRLTSQGLLSSILVKLSQTVVGTRLTQVYSLENEGAKALSLRIDAVIDGDIDTGLGSNQNWALHDTRWPGAAAAGSAAATITDSTRLIGVTLALTGGAPEGYRSLRASAPGYEIYRVPTLGGYYDPAFLNGLFTFPAASFGSGVSRPFTDEITDDADGDSASDAAGDIVLGLQTNLTLAPGATQAVTLTTTLFSGGPYLVAPTCPLPGVNVLGSVDVALTAASSFGTPKFSVASGALPAGLTITNGHLVGAPTQGGKATFDLVVTDERGRTDTLPCSITVTGCGTSCAMPGPCESTGACDLATSTCVYPSLPDGVPCGAGQCLAGQCVGGGNSGAGSAGTASTTGSAGTASTTGSGANATGAGGGTASGPVGVGADGSGGDAGGASSPTGGCSCDVARASRALGSSTRSATWAGLALLLVAGRRRRARRSR